MATSNLKRIIHYICHMHWRPLWWRWFSISRTPYLRCLSFLFRGGGAIAQTLGFWVIVVQLVALLTILYANAFVTKNRLKEYGLYSISWARPKNIQLLSFIELLLFSVVSVGLGLCLESCSTASRLPYWIEAHSEFQIGIEYSMQFGSVGFVLISMAFIFRSCLLLKCDKDVHEPSVEMLSREEKERRRGALVSSCTHWCRASREARIICRKRLKHPLQRYDSFFVAVLLVILATYILFDAGSIVLLSLCKRTNVSLSTNEFYFDF